MNVINQGIYNTLKAGTALTALLAGTTSIYNMQAPDSATLPYVVFNLQAGGADPNMPTNAINVLYYVRGFTKVSAAAAGSIATQIDALLHGKSVSVSGYSNYWCNHEQEIDSVQNLPNGEKVYSNGFYYRIKLD
jgi:hypothetical protein